MRTWKRTDRIASLIKDALSEMLVLDVSDPRVHDAVVTHVRVSGDLSIARVYVRSIVSDEQSRGELLTGLEAAGGFLRSGLAHRVKLFRVPELQFFYDDQEDEAARLDAILEELSRH